jgi:hypothetical protein
MPEVRATIEKICCQLVDWRRASRQLKREKPGFRNTGSEKTRSSGGAFVRFVP